ncbi:hypothetical protein M6B38_100845 [Iris pallida]|uniref:Uncharacterized protein n=1 Tax=Iris pallida TaxID=29817 RepID=A0AAX6IM19_IRIPA|nr:hypothetical protein M6B38_100845 [Iris pallida]
MGLMMTCGPLIDNLVYRSYGNYVIRIMAP